MKRLSILFAIGWALLAFGCADPLEQRKGSEVQQQLERGFGGGGQLGPVQRASDDPAGEHAVPQDHP
jgi:hypothetical protein